MLNGYLYSQLSFSNLTAGDFHGKGGGVKPLWRAPKYVVVLCFNAGKGYYFAVKIMCCAIMHLQIFCPLMD